MNSLAVRFSILLITSAVLLVACGTRKSAELETIRIVDQLGRNVEIPRHMSRISALHHFGGRIIYALRQQNRLVEQSLYGREARVLSRVDPKFAAMPRTQEQSGHLISYESLIALRPQCAFVYASFNRSEMQQLENAGIKVVAVKGETLDESFAAIRLIAKVLGCEEKGEEYIKTCSNLISLVQERVGAIPQERKLRVLFTGPNSIYSVATGEMLQSQMLDRAGAVNLAASLKGFWNTVSPEQVMAWNPDVIFVGSALDNSYAVNAVLQNPQFQSIDAVRNKRVYLFPSNIGWWDYPAPSCVLGVVWAAQALYPERFKDVDMTRIADDFYLRYLGHTFTSMGGKL